MGKKGIKQYARIASKYGTKFEGYNVPVGAIYGRVLIPYEKGTEYIFFICTQPKNIRKDTMPIYVLKPSWVSNRWREMLIGREHPAFTAVANICHEIGGIPKIKTFQDPKVAEKRAEKAIDRAYKQVSRQYGLRPVPCNGVPIKPEYDSYVTPQQARIPWDELVHDFRPLSGSYISQYHPRNPMSCLGRIGGLRGKSNFIEIQPFWKVKSSHKSSI